MTQLPYLQNNIIFRIASADAISKFKAAQAHTLIQISRREFEFEAETREVLLLSYDRVSTWVLRVERAFLVQNGDEIGDEFRNRIIADLGELFVSVEDVFKNHPDVFSERLIAYVKLVHGYSFPVIASALQMELSGNICAALGKMLELLTKYLQHLLITLHEFNNNVVLKRDAFICASEFSTSAPGDLKLQPIKARVKFFSKSYGIRSFLIKNYTNSEIEADIIEALGQQGATAKLEMR